MRIEIPHMLPEHPPYVVKVKRLGTEYLANKILGVVARRISPRKWEVLLKIPGHISEKARIVR